MVIDCFTNAGCVKHYLWLLIQFISNELAEGNAAQSDMWFSPEIPSGIGRSSSWTVNFSSARTSRMTECPLFILGIPVMVVLVWSIAKATGPVHDLVSALIYADTRKQFNM